MGSKNEAFIGRVLIIDEEYNQHLTETKIIKENFPEFEVYELEYSREKVLELAENVVGILVQIYFQMDMELLSNLPKLKAISVYGGGFNNVDVQYATQKGIKVSRVPDYSNHEVAEHVIWSILYFAKKPFYLSQRGRQGFWGARAVSDEPIDTWDPERMENLPRRVHGSILLIIGYGKIGRTIASKANGLGMNVLFYDPYVKEGDATAVKVELEEGLRRADYVVVSAPLTQTSKNLINYNTLKLMKKTAYLVNIGRGGVVNEADLIKALKEKIIRGASLDVFENEPLPKDSPFYTMPNVVVTPHAVYISDKSIRDLKVIAATNLVKLIKGESVPGCVNCQ